MMPVEFEEFAAVAYFMAALVFWHFRGR